ncbi:MAG: FHA domain-containing protein [Planctomycetes bacterium]|nr:FHA domain-containing protein [Planctomycetota bacterium]
MPSLEILSGENWGQSFSFSHEIKVGKDPSCTVKLADAGVSRFHARLGPGASGVTIEDLGSSNGTYVNFKKRPRGEAIQLKDQDVIFFGRTVAKFWAGARPETHEPLTQDPKLDASLRALIRSHEQREVLRRLRLHELDPESLDRLLAQAR